MRLSRRSALWIGAVAMLTSAASGGPDEDLAPMVKIKDLGFSTEKRVIGGLEARAGQFPWQVSLLVQKYDGIYLCGGSVIAPGWVLSAAHCVEDKYAPGATARDPKLLAAPDIDVRSGSLYLSRRGLQAQVTSYWRMDKRISEPSEFDIVLLRVPTHASATPIGLIASTTTPGEETIRVGTSLRVSGFGRTETASSSPVLKYVDVSYVRRESCASSQGYGAKVKSSMICAGIAQGGKDSCQGDSGGPLIDLGAAGAGQAPRLVGVVSWGKGCAQPNKPGVYTNLAHPEIAAWIAATMTAHQAEPLALGPSR